MVPQHILTSELYKQLYNDYDNDKSFLNNIFDTFRQVF